MTIALARCKHATEATTVEEDTCKCKGCEAGWGGDMCNKCMLKPSFCGIGGVLDNETCQCKCKGQWVQSAEGSCTKCNITKCLHGGKLSPKTCSCDCTSELSVWSGTKCDVCAVPKDGAGKCNGHGKFSMGDCKCKCSDNWHGKFCSTCGLQNSACSQYNLTLDASKCECKCMKTAATCNKLQIFDKATCSCLPKPTCAKVCPMDQKLDKDRCECFETEKPCPKCKPGFKNMPEPDTEEAAKDTDAVSR